MYRDEAENAFWHKKHVMAFCRYIYTQIVPGYLSLNQETVYLS